MAARTGKARLAGVIGSPVSHSMSPALHEFWLKKHDVDGAYIPLLIKPDTLRNSINTLINMGFSGFNVTLPYKEAMYDIVDRLDITAKNIGAVNTVIIDKETKELIGKNTDGYGFVANLEQNVSNIKLNNTKTFIIGAGGAARAVIVGLAEAGCKELVICNRTLDRAEKLKSQMNERIKNIDITICCWSDISNHLQNNIDLLVNTTQLGMAGQLSLEIDLSGLKQSAIVTDIVYNPLKTKLLLDAESKGYKIVDGLGMLLWQAAAGFESWFGVCPEVSDELKQYIITIMNKNTG